MDFQNLKKDAESRMGKTIESLKADLKKVRTGRAQVTMLDSVKVEYYGSLTPLNQVASVSTPDAKSFLITPWETSVLKDIEAAIVKSDLGMSPMNDGKSIRLKLPDLTEERRKELVKTIKKILEEARVAVRNTRRDINELIKKAQKDKEISEDEEKRHLDEIQKVTDKYIAEIDKIGEEKEKDILTF
jgi:ribosome recycling factor